MFSKVIVVPQQGLWKNSPKIFFQNIFFCGIRWTF